MIPQTFFQIALELIFIHCFEKCEDDNAFISLDEILAFLQFFHFNLSTFTQKDFIFIFTLTRDRMIFIIDEKTGVVGRRRIRRQAWVGRYDIGKAPHNQSIEDMRLEDFIIRDYARKTFEKKFLITRNAGDPASLEKYRDDPDRQKKYGGDHVDVGTFWDTLKEGEPYLAEVKNARQVIFKLIEAEFFLLAPNHKDQTWQKGQAKKAFFGLKIRKS